MQLPRYITWMLVLALLAGAAVYAFTAPRATSPAPEEPTIALSTPSPTTPAASPSPVASPAPAVGGPSVAAVPGTAPTGTSLPLLLMVSVATVLSAAFFARKILTAAASE